MDSYRVLVVDDEVMVRGLVFSLLSKNGHTCEVAKGGIEALEKIKKDSFDAVVSDIVMPHMNGITLTEELLRAHSNSNLPVMLMTGHSHKYSAESAVAAGAREFIKKPFSGLDWVFTERALEDAIRPLVRKETTTIRGLLFPLEWEKGDPGGFRDSGSLSWSDRRIAPDRPCLLQHSSGTTGLQKAVVLSHRAVLDHLLRYGTSIQANGGDKIVSWLPLYHDMGLIAAFYLPLTLGIPVVQTSTLSSGSLPP